MLRVQNSRLHIKRAENRQDNNRAFLSDTKFKQNYFELYDVIARIPRISLQKIIYTSAQERKE